MSTSKGRGAAAHTIAEVIPPEQLRFLFLRPRPNQAIEFDPGRAPTPIPRLFDEFDRFAAATAGREVKGEIAPGLRGHVPLLAARPGRGRRRRGGRLPAGLRPPRAARPDPGRRRRRPGRGGEGESADRARDARSSTSGSAAARAWLEAYAPERARLAVQRDALPDEAAGSTTDQRRFLAALADARRARRADRRRRVADARSSRSPTAPDLPAGRAFAAHLPRVPRPAERPARRLAAGEPRPGVRRRAPARGRGAAAATAGGAA